MKTFDNVSLFPIVGRGLVASVQCPWEQLPQAGEIVKINGELRCVHHLELSTPYRGHAGLVLLSAPDPAAEFEVKVVQFLRPNGQAADMTTMLPVEVKLIYEAMCAAGCRFEAEVLRNGLVSMTISDPKKEKDLDINVSVNGPAVPAGMVMMLKRSRWNQYGTKPSRSAP